MSQPDVRVSCLIWGKIKFPQKCNKQENKQPGSPREATSYKLVILVTTGKQLRVIGVNPSPVSIGAVFQDGPLCPGDSSSSALGAGIVRERSSGEHLLSCTRVF